MKNKRSVMAVSGLMIIFFHLWINLFRQSELESFLKQTAYAGVDIFFFVSGISIGMGEITEWKHFVIGRLKKIYPSYLFYALAAMLISGWTVIRFLKVSLGIELFEKGGGSFLWFVPAILLYYMVCPLIKRMYARNRGGALIICLGIWLGVGLLVTGLTDYRAIFIFWNRIPAFMAGFVVGEESLIRDKLESTGVRLWLGLLFTLSGGVLVYYFAYRYKLQAPVADMFYVIALVYAVGIVLLASLIPEGRAVRMLGSITLDMYGVQMVFGYKITNKLLKIVGNVLLTNILSILLIIFIAYLINIAFNYKRISSIHT